MDFKITKNNPNYTARFVKLGQVLKHPNADRLQFTMIDGNSVITGLDAKEGDIYVYFPLGCKINEKYLSDTNSFQSKELNADKDKRGFFPNSGVVKATRLRSQKSEGYIVPAQEFCLWLGYKDEDFIGFGARHVGVEFDTYKDIVICEKYINSEALRKAQEALNRESKKSGKKARVSRILENQFYLSLDTVHLKKFIQDINPEDYITISSKWHGANISVGKVLCRKKLGLKDRIAKWLGVNVIDYDYDYVVGSRRVVKNKYADQQSVHYYDEDVWTSTAMRYKDSIANGITIHAELVGYTSSGGAIQSSKGVAYDYGCEVGKADIYVYRIFYTGLDGKTYEFSTPQALEYCEKYGLKHVPVFYHGKAKDKYPELSTEEHWHENFIKKLEEEYLEKECEYCNNKGLWDEGIVVSKHGLSFSPYKLKSFSFVGQEQEDVEKGEVNLEDENN